MEETHDYVISLGEIGRTEVPKVGGKNASLGELIRGLGASGIVVPPGFATTVDAYWRFVDANRLREVIVSSLQKRATGRISLEEAGKEIRTAFLRSDWPREISSSISLGYRKLCKDSGREDIDVAVRSSATAEDLPTASFAGQQESFLNIRGEQTLLDACRRCYASLFTDRAISYREANGFDHLKVGLSIGVQKMVRADLGGAGVMFSIDPETGFNKVVLINAAWGLGEPIVQGAADPDEYVVFKPLLPVNGMIPIVEKQCGSKAIKMIYDSASGVPTRSVPTSPTEQRTFVLSDAEILKLARWAIVVENHYGCPMDMEWAKDGETGELFMLQARPETVQSRRSQASFRSYRLKAKGKVLASGIAIGDAVVTGLVCLVDSPDRAEHFPKGAVLVAPTTDPDWLPVMRQASAIVTDHGGRTSHAAIVSRELGLPAIVGAGNVTGVLKDGQNVTISCAEGDVGFVYEGKVDFEVDEETVDDLPSTRTKVMLNMANPAAAFRWWRSPSDGVGLARMEFVISQLVKIHPMALVHLATLKDQKAKGTIEELTAEFTDKAEYFVERLARGLSRILAAHHPHPVIIRMSDFKTNEYANLIGGREFEPVEENPMLGFRGASRYYDPRYKEGFALECKAIRRLRLKYGFKNVIVMIPFCRTIREADLVLAEMALNDLKRGVDGLKVYVMCEIPANVVLAKAFAERFDGFSIGSNDLTQLTLGVDRDSTDLAALFDEQDDAVKWMIRSVIAEAHELGVPVGLCGQAPSDHPEFAEFLVECGIDSVSVSPDSFVSVKRHIASAEQRQSVREQSAL